MHHPNEKSENQVEGTNTDDRSVDGKLPYEPPTVLSQTAFEVNALVSGS